MSGRDYNNGGPQDQEVFKGTDFTIKPLYESTNQNISIKEQSPVDQTGDPKQSIVYAEGSSVDGTKSVNREKSVRPSTSTGKSKKSKNRKESYPEITIVGDRYDDAFVEYISNQDGSSDTEDNENSASDDTKTLLPSTGDKNMSKSVVQQSSVESVETDSTSTNATFSFRTLGSRHKLVLISICLCNFLSYLCLSLIAPFFPDEANKKDVSDTVSGWIFGIYAFTQFLLSPVFGRLVPLVGVKFLYIGGLLLAAGCTVLFGCLTYIDTTNENITFIIYCFVLRVMLALGCCGLQTSSFTLTAKEFPDSVATVFGITEVFVGIGFMSGPPIGGFLYASGGFVMPFAVVGALMFLGVPFNIWLIPSDRGGDRTENKGQHSVFVMFKSSKTYVNCLAVIVAAMIYSILDPTLEPHLNDSFDMSSEIIGLLFLLMAGFYAVSSPIVGSIADRLPDNRAVLIPGFTLAAIGMLLLGPSDLLWFHIDELWLNIVCLIILGITSSMALIPTFDIFIDIAQELGFDEGMGMYGMVAGIWGSMYAFGDFLGPSLGGFLLEQYGFPTCCTVTAGACLFMVPLLTISWLYDTKCCTEKSWTEQPETVIDVEDETMALLRDDNEDLLRTYPPYQAITTA